MEVQSLNHWTAREVPVISIMRIKQRDKKRWRLLLKVIIDDFSEEGIFEWISELNKKQVL